MNIIYIKSVYVAAVPFFWPQPAFLPDQYQPCTGSQHFATYIKALVPRFTIPASSAARVTIFFNGLDCNVFYLLLFYLLQALTLILPPFFLYLFLFTED